MACLKAIDKMAQPVRDNGRSFRGFKLFLEQDYRLFLTVARGEWAISGFPAADLRTDLPSVSASHSSYLRLRTHGLIKKIGHRYKYYLTKLGRRLAATGQRSERHVPVDISSRAHARQQCPVLGALRVRPSVTPRP